MGAKKETTLATYETIIKSNFDRNNKCTKRTIIGIEDWPEVCIRSFKKYRRDK